MSSAKSSKLEDQAASAALYATKGKNNKSGKSSNYPLDADGKLSSASAATSLKHAQPQDLPAFPIVGVQNSESSAGAAASLANANQKPIELWEPSEIPEANRAAHLAKDYKSDPVWQPDLGPAGSTAALQAHREGADVKIWRPTESDAGQSAAGQAMRSKLPPSRVTRGGTADGNQKALMAAVGAVSGNRQRSGSTPVALSSYPDAANSASNALKAATSANRPSKASQNTSAKSPQFNAGRVHNQAVTNLSREMYTSHPPVAPEVEEKNKQDTLRAAAVVMAKKMYDVQQKRIQEDAALRRADSQYAASAAGERPLSSASSGGGEPPKYVNLEEAARKLASERLAKLHDEHAAYRDYYGQSSAPNKRMSLRGRRRASSDGNLGESDGERSRQIRTQMSIFSDQVKQVDEKKRKQDRESLLAAAQRNVRANMDAQDQRVFNETGKISPAMMAEWEAKARAKAESDSQARLVNHGMVNIGGGKFLDQSEVDAIAAAKVQPTLDDITETAEKQRARDEELRQQQLERQRIANEKAADDRERETKTKDEWRQFREDEKREEKARKDEAKAKKQEEKKSREEDKRKTALGKIKGIFVKDENDGGNKEALQKLEGKKQHEEELEPTGAASSEPLAKDLGDDHDESLGTSGKGPVTVPAISGDGSLAKQVVSRIEATEKGELPTAESPLASNPPDSKFTAEPTSASVPKTETIHEEPKVDAKPEPPTEITPTAEPKASEAQSAPKALFKPVEPAPKKPGEPAPLADRIALPAAAIQPTTETTVTGGTQSATSPTREKDGSKVSSWLKSKLGRRSSKAATANPADTSSSKPTISAPKDPKVFVGAANLGAPDSHTTRDSSDAADSSMRAVALAGRNAGPVDAPAATPTHANDEEGTHRPSAAGASSGFAADAENNDETASISSLSSDEDTRGRSNTRLADQLEANKKQHVQPEPEKPVAPASTAQKDFAAGRLKERGFSSDEFVQAKEHLDLEPPDKSILGRKSGEGKKSDSPVRDSKFVEQL